MPLKSCIFCEFDVTLGPELIAQYPEDYVSKSEFSVIKKYIITKPELVGKIVTITIGRHQIVGFPMDVPGDYARNHYLFNLAFVFEKGADYTRFEPLIRKIGEFLKDLEGETRYLSKKETKALVPGLLSSIMNGLNSAQQCSFTFDSANTIRLQLIPPSSSELPVVRLHDVPIMLVDPRLVASSLFGDLTFEKVVGYIDGVNHVQRISLLSGVDTSYICTLLSSLVHFKLTMLVDVFQFCNRYVVTSRVKELLSSPSLLQECVDYITENADHPRAGFEAVFAMYCQLCSFETIQVFCDRNSLQQKNINPRRFIQFGLMRELVRAVKKYPVMKIEDFSIVEKLGVNTLDGSISTDEICCRTECSAKEIDDMVDKAPSAMIIWK